MDESDSLAGHRAAALVGEGDGIFSDKPKF